MAHIRHIGLVVEDIDRAVIFYTKVFGLSVLSKNIEEGAYIDALVGLSNAKVQWVKLTSQENTVFLELLKYHNHPSQKHAPPAYQHGCSHIAITVNDMHETLKKVREYGGIADDFLYNPEKTVRVVYARDPEGIILELVEDVR